MGRLGTMSVRIIAAVFFVFCLTLSSNGQAEEILVRFSHVVGENTPKGIGAKMFRDKVNARLAGKVRVEVYPRSQLMTDDQVLIGILAGRAEMAAPSLAKFKRFTEKLQVFDLPFLFDGIEAVHRFQESPAGRGLLGSMDRSGLKGLTYWDNGMRVMSANRSVRRPEDLKGLTFRIEPSAVFQRVYNSLDVASIPMAFKQLTDAVRIGLVNAQENTWSNIHSRRLVRYQKHFTELDHSYLGYMVVTSRAFWDGLPEDVRSEMSAILAEVTEEVKRLAISKAAEGRAAVIAGGGMVVQATVDDRQVWREALSPVWDDFAEEIGEDVMTAAREANRRR